MRHVNFNPATLQLPNNWQARVDALNAQLIAEADVEQRTNLITQNSEIWAEIKAELSKVFNYKCWYTESRQIGTDVDVDHYRPKNRVAELRTHTPPHSGYWWLAFNLANYRYSCIVANRRRRDIETDQVGGKADFFPVWDEAFRVWDQNGNIDDEQPMLLDPCKASDVRLLDFKDDGEAMPRENAETRPRLHARADISIKYYNINHSDFVRARIALRDELQKLVRDAERYYNKLENGDATHEHAYEQTIRKIRELTDERAEFSSFSLAYLQKFRHLDALAGVL